MTDYGVQPTGYVRKPLAVQIAELEAAMITEFGPGVIQTPQSPFGQLNGLMADLLTEIDERNLDTYQSYDPDQAENTRLDILGRIRLISRGVSSDSEYRQRITNAGQGRIDIQDISAAVLSIPGVTYAKVFVNETGEITIDGLELGTVAVAIIGGDDSIIAATLRKFIVPGVTTYGNVIVSSLVDGFCRSIFIIRPIEIAVTLNVEVLLTNDKFDCPPPSTLVIANTVNEGWLNERINGQDPSFYNIRTIIESAFSNVEVKSVSGVRDEIVSSPVPISFIEIATVTTNVVSV